MGFDPTHPNPELAAKRERIRRLVTRLVLLDVVLLAVGLVAWLALRGDGNEGNAVNPGLRGSKPPAGQVFPNLAAIDGIEPVGTADFPTRSALRGRATMLVATCVECRSGDIVGGFLSRLGEDDVPSGARVLVLGWDGDVAAWAGRHGLVAHELYRAAPGDATNKVRRSLGIGPVDGAEESGIAFIYDTEGRWRSSFYLGQLDRADIRHDLEELADD